MVYAYDQWAQMPVKDLYDTQMMAMAISAAKDMYDKNQKQIDDFYKDFGSFYSPTASHMNFYNQNFDISGFIDDLYKNGVDPFRSPEGRQAIRRYINTRPYSKLAEYKKSAENYDTYLKSVGEQRAKNLFNPAYEDFILNGKTIENLGKDEIWDRLSAGSYQDLNQYTGHLFDKMDDEFMGTDEYGRDWYGVSPERRMQALTPMMGDLLSTDLGKFHYEQSRNNAAKLLKRTPTEDEVMKQFANDVITATHEYDKRNYKENPEYKRQKEYEYANKLDANKQARNYHYDKLKLANTPGYDENGNPIVNQEGVSMHEWSYNNALSNAIGQGYSAETIGYHYDEVGKNINRVQREFGERVGQDKKAFQNRYTQTRGMSVEDIKHWHQGNLTVGGFQANLGDIAKLKSVDDVITHTRGFKGGVTRTSQLLQDKVEEALNNNYFVEILPKGGTYGAQNKENVFTIDAPCKIRIYQNVDGTGSFDEFDGYWNVDQDSEKAPSTYYESSFIPNNWSNDFLLGRMMNRNRSLLGRTNQDDPANVYPKQWNISSDTKATSEQYKAGQSVKLATSYK